MSLARIPARAWSSPRLVRPVQSVVRSHYQNTSAEFEAHSLLLPADVAGRAQFRVSAKTRHGPAQKGRLTHPAHQAAPDRDFKNPPGRSWRRSNPPASIDPTIALGVIFIGTSDSLLRAARDNQKHAHRNPSLSENRRVSREFGRCKVVG